MDKAQLTAAVETAHNAIQSLIDAANTAKKPLSSEDRATIATHEAAIETAEGQLADLAADELLATRQAERTKKIAADKVAAAKAARNGRKTAADPVITRQKLNLEDDPQKGFASPREFIAQVIMCGQGAEPDERLRFLSDDRLNGLHGANRNLAAGSDEARGNSDPAGGFLVPMGFSPQLLQVTPEADPLGAMTRKIPMEQTIVKIPARTDKDHSSSVAGGVTVTRRPETVAGTASQMTFEQVVLQAMNLFGLSYTTEELLTDSPMSFIAILQAGFSDQFTYALTKERLFGTGVGEYLGMINPTNPALVAIAKETNQAATTFVYENAIKMRARCWQYGRAIWLANHDTLPQFVLMNQGVGTGGLAVFQPGSRLSMVDQDVPDNFLGRPLIFTEYTKSLGTTGDVALVVPSEFLEGQYQPLESAESMHVRFVNHERVFKFWVRNAGQPWWKSALTPAFGSNTLSPFITCAAR